MSYKSLDQDTRTVAEGLLTRKQLDVLKLWLNGYGTTRIALMLDISEPRARHIKNRALQKLKPYVQEELL